MHTQTLAEPPGVLKLIGHTVRWNLVRFLARSDYCVQDLVDRLDLPQNLVSYHLRQLRQGRLATERRSVADERSIYYSLDLEQLHLLYRSAGETLHPAVIEDMVSSPRIQSPPGQSLPPLHILFLCTENSARSQLAEALLRHLSHGSITAFSAGSAPAHHIRGPDIFTPHFPR
ncbi:MAG: ArsR family transcriptional regulator [Chloroflexota bacterium]|nr:ArsR family transcriptional regulator [Chloroflexota bacterium]